MKENKIRKPKEKRIKGFAGAALIYAASLVIVFAVLIGILCAFLYTYENNLPLKAAEKFLLSLDDEKYFSLVESAAGELCEFENAELLVEKTEHLSGKTKVAKLAKEYTSARPVYRLICDDKDIGKIILSPREKKAAFGITAFEVSEAMLYPESVPGAIEKISLSICVPADATLLVNGKEAGEEYITRKKVKYSGKTIVPEGRKCDIYEIDGLCLVPELAVGDYCEYIYLTVANGKADWFSEDIKSFVMTVPSNAEVLIGGVAPSPSLAIEGELSEALSEFESGLGEKLPKALSYRVFGECRHEGISVTANGKKLVEKELEGKRESVYLYSADCLYNAKITAPENAEIYINDVSVSEKYLMGKSEYEDLSALKKYSNDENAMRGVTYNVHGLICEPEISAKIDGKEIPLCSIKKNELDISAEFYGAESELAKNAENAAAEFTKAYFHYVANGAVGIEENYGALISKMKAQSPAFKQIQRSRSSFEFVNQGVYRIDLLEPKNFIGIGGLIYCEVDYSVHLRFYRNEKLYEGTLSLVLIKENDTYLVCDMVIDSES